MKKFCRANYLSFQRMREWLDIHSQIATILEACGFKKMETGESAGSELFSPLYAAIHRSILSGFLANIAMKKEKNIFKATKAEKS